MFLCSEKKNNTQIHCTLTCTLDKELQKGQAGVEEELYIYIYIYISILYSIHEIRKFVCLDLLIHGGYGLISSR